MFIDTNRVPWRHSFARKYKDFLFVNPSCRFFCRFFRKFWLTKESTSCKFIFILTNKMVNKIIKWSTFQTKAIYDEVSGTFTWLLGQKHFKKISRQRCLRFVTNWLRKIYTISSSARDRSPLSSRRNRSLYLLCRQLKLLKKTRFPIYLNVLGPRGLSAFNFRSLSERCCEAIK